MQNIRTLIAAAFTLAILMLIAYYLGKSLEGFIAPLIVWLLLAINGMRKKRSQNNCSL